MKMNNKIKLKQLVKNIITVESIGIGDIPTGRFLYGCNYCGKLDDFTHICVTCSRLQDCFS